MGCCGGGSLWSRRPGGLAQSRVAHPTATAATPPAQCMATQQAITAPPSSSGRAAACRLAEATGRRQGSGRPTSRLRWPTMRNGHTPRSFRLDTRCGSHISRRHMPRRSLPRTRDGAVAPRPRAAADSANIDRRRWRWARVSVKAGEAEHQGDGGIEDVVGHVDSSSEIVVVAEVVVDDRKKRGSRRQLGLHGSAVALVFGLDLRRPIAPSR